MIIRKRTTKMSVSAVYRYEKFTFRECHKVTHIGEHSV